MTEAQWLSCSDPRPMLASLSGHVSERKLRLFACACCYRIWRELEDERSRQAVIVAERYADGLATAEELETVAAAAHEVWEADRRRTSPNGEEWHELDDPLPYSAAAYNIAIPPGWWGGAPAFVAPYRVILERASNRAAEGAAQCTLLREIVGNPFRPVTINSSWLTSTVVTLAEGIYQKQAFDRLPILADALEESGCANQDVLAHCRHPREHVRGCWVIDLLLGKE